MHFDLALMRDSWARYSFRSEVGKWWPYLFLHFSYPQLPRHCCVLATYKLWNSGWSEKYKILQGFQYFTSGWVLKVDWKMYQEENVLILGKVEHSYVASKTPIHPWVLVGSNRIVLIADYTCMARASWNLFSYGSCTALGGSICPCSRQHCYYNWSWPSRSVENTSMHYRLANTLRGTMGMEFHSPVNSYIQPVPAEVKFCWTQETNCYISHLYIHITSPLIHWQALWAWSSTAWCTCSLLVLKGLKIW